MAPIAPGRYVGQSGKAVGALLLLGLMLVGLLACSGESSTLGQYRQGRTLHFSVVSLERTGELRYSTIDPNGIVRRWSLSPSAEGKELVLVRTKIENHTAVSAIINVDRTAAELRDFANATYLPMDIGGTARRDFRGEPEALVRVDLGQCFDSPRVRVDVGSTVKWQSESDDDQYIAFEDAAVAVGPGGRANLTPGGSLAHSFNQPGTFPYVCGSPGSPGSLEWPAEVNATGPVARQDYLERPVQFIRGSFELLKGQGLDGFLVFEAPVGVEFRDMRWRAGDSITFRF